MTDDRREYLEADGLGGFASGTVAGPRTRRYHGLLVVARQPPVDRVLLVQGFEATLVRGPSRVAVTAQRYAPGVVTGASRAVERFQLDPWPTWELRLEDGTLVRQEIVALHHTLSVAVRWTLLEGEAARLEVRPLLAGRDIHALHHENDVLRLDTRVNGAHLAWQTYESMPIIHSWAEAQYTPAPVWYRRFELTEELARGFGGLEDGASPGVLTFDLRPGPAACWLLSTAPPLDTDGAAGPVIEGFIATERSRRFRLGGPLERAADAYIVRRGEGRSIIAGYPWFTDWGRDTFIALRGLCLATGRLPDGRAVLLAWAGEVSEGMLPNRFVDQGGEPEFNAVDASLWFVIAAHEYLAAARRHESGSLAADRQRLGAAVQQILAGYARGTRFGIVADEDGLLRCGVAGVQLTWMDARVGDWVVTPRIGKPVEVQALWINALRIGGRRWAAMRRRAESAFVHRFWNEELGCLHDVVDVDHVAGQADARVRPNQVLAVGGLPWPLLHGNRARRVVEVVERELWTPLGPRSLAASAAGYAAHYAGGPSERDAAYHMGTVWPWLAGPFIEAWLRVHRGPRAVADARRRFLEPLLAHAEAAGVGHVSEVADAEPPFTPGGCPFQAWSVGELLRIQRMLAALDTSVAA